MIRVLNAFNGSVLHTFSVRDALLQTWWITCFHISGSILIKLTMSLCLMTLRATTTVKVYHWRPASRPTHSLSWSVSSDSSALRLNLFLWDLSCDCVKICLVQVQRTDEFTCGAQRAGWRWPCWTVNIQGPSTLCSLTPNTWRLPAPALTWWEVIQSHQSLINLLIYGRMYKKS